jgi:hypothetical protein
MYNSKIFGFVNYLFGKDISIDVGANKENFYLKHGEKTNLEFNIYLQGNSFCKARCSYRFWDISRNLTIKEDNFTLDILSKTINFTLSPERLGIGQELYRYDQKCTGQYSTLCQISQKDNYHNIIISMQYNLSDEEKILKENSLKDLDSMLMNINNWHSDLLYFEDILNQLDNYAIVENLEAEKNILQEDISSVDDYMFDLEHLWNKQDYYYLNDRISQNELFNNFNKSFILKKNLILGNISLYNFCVNKTELTREMLTEMKIALVLNMSNFSKYLEVNETIFDFNSKIKIIIEKNSLDFKNKITQEIFNKTLLLYNYFKNESSNETIPYIKYENISEEIIRSVQASRQYYYLDISFNEPHEQCCVFNSCEDCCYDETCFLENLPVVFVHGHDFSKYVSAENNLYSLNKIQDKLESDGFLNAGSISLSSRMDNQGIWGIINYPMTLKVSYYLGIENVSGEFLLIQDKNEDITTYANRLKSLIDIVKFKTGKSKVVIIAYSMGGLVTRRYIQLYREDSVSKLILFAVPNKGIEGEIKSFCPVLGESKECKDMEVNSTFMQELSSAPNLTIQVYAIVGTGCTMLDGKGDGIVLERNAKLEGAKTYIIKGDCSGGFLHTKLNDPAQYPKAYGILKEILKGEA